MIRLPDPAGLAPAERFGLTVLVDLARLVPVDDPAADVVTLEVVDAADAPLDLHKSGPRDILFTPGDGSVRLPRTALRAVTDLAGAGVEQRSTARDRYDRVPASENPLVRAGLERQPHVSQVAASLRRAVVRAAGRRPVRLVAPWPGGKRWAAALTHDLDVVAAWPAFTLLRLAELARKGQMRRGARVVGSAAAAIGHDPVGRGIAGILETERSHGVRSTWFVLCGTPTLQTVWAGDLTYRPESRTARAILETIGGAEGELALHGSFETLDRPAVLATQRERLSRLGGRPVVGVRQHYVRMRPGATQRAMASVGFTYDSTFGFPDRNGFRLGVADSVPGWDEQRGEPLPLEEVPFTWMDRALSKYRGVEDPAAWVSDGLELAAAARAVEGLWVGLWHPNLVPALGYPDAPPAYARLLHGLLAGDPFVAPVHVLARWRRRRRSTRILRLAPDGRAEALVPESGEDPVTLEDAAGRALENIMGARR